MNPYNAGAPRLTKNQIEERMSACTNESPRDCDENNLQGMTWLAA